MAVTFAKRVTATLCNFIRSYVNEYASCAVLCKALLSKDVQAGNVARMQKDIVRITEATEKMQRLLSELLELSRIGRIANPSTHVSFKTIVEEALSIVRGRLETRHVKMELADKLRVVFVDQARLVQVLQNLLDNAAKSWELNLTPK